jgi:hypothetical protein
LFTGEAYDDIGWTQRIDDDVYIWKTEKGCKSFLFRNK